MKKKLISLVDEREVLKEKEDLLKRELKNTRDEIASYQESIFNHIKAMKKKGLKKTDLRKYSDKKERSK